MTPATPATDTRRIEVTLDIAAPVSAVWRALTDARELERWFPVRAEVTPGPGGAIRWTWAPDVDWPSHIDLWEAERRLRATYDRPMTHAGGPLAASALLAMDFTLESEGGRTVLRLVHSGFGSGGDWEDEYHGVRRGWGFELRCLRHYLERHAGQDRQVLMLRAPVHESKESAWRRFIGPEGLGLPEDLAHAREGDPWRATLATGEELSGTVFSFAPPHEFGATVAELGDGILRVGVEKIGGGLEAWLWFAVWNAPGDAFAGFRERWRERMRLLFPEGEAGA
jgi:uncharacterized protein YndB with AHSA1/START domain